MDFFLEYVSKNMSPKEILDQCFKYKTLCKRHRKKVCELLLKRHGYVVDGSYDACQVYLILHKVLNVSYIRNMDAKDPLNVQRILYIKRNIPEPYKTQLLQFIKVNQLE
ncbi:hypothetical protein EB118_01985 [bacterium]|nr:hypothetical protein [bacterium]NDC94187.1 hypothetical protein [bacterium]NDD83019.1 hypothetical protein [bacterium]NDG28857.1 hypothetical protein [bacterium]